MEYQIKTGLTTSLPFKNNRMKFIKNIKNIFSNNNFNTMKKGTVKFFNNSKGFGFITPENSNEDIFVHQSGLIDRIGENDKVQFEMEQGKKGMNAVRVSLVN